MCIHEFRGGASIGALKGSCVYVWLLSSNLNDNLCSESMPPLLSLTTGAQKLKLEQKETNANFRQIYGTVDVKVR